MLWFLCCRLYPYLPQPIAPLQLRELSEEEASRQLQTVDIQHFDRIHIFGRSVESFRESIETALAIQNHRWWSRGRRQLGRQNLDGRLYPVSLSHVRCPNRLFGIAYTSRHRLYERFTLLFSAYILSHILETFMYTDTNPGEW